MGNSVAGPNPIVAEDSFAKRSVRRLGGGFILPADERRRLHRRSHLRQQRDQGEVCGVLLATRRRCLELIFVSNVSRSPGQFAMAQSDIRDIRRLARVRKRAVIGFFHSHPISTAVPSEGDVRRAPLRSFHLIYDVCGREPKLWYYTRRSHRLVAIEFPLLIRDSSS